MESQAHDPTSPTTVGWTRMEDGTAEDYAALTENFNQHVRDSLVDHLFALLRAMQGPRFGYRVDRYRHSLQSGTRALRNGEDVEIVQRGQKGLAAGGYTPGRLSPRFEEPLHRFHNMLADRFTGTSGVPSGDESDDQPLYGTGVNPLPWRGIDD